MSHVAPAGDFRVFVWKVLRAERSGVPSFPRGSLTVTDTQQDCVCANPFLYGLGFPLSAMGGGEALLKGRFCSRLKVFCQVSKGSWFPEQLSFLSGEQGAL